MSISRFAVPAVVAGMLAVLPLASAEAQYYGPYYGPPCTPFPLTWPFCIAGAVVGTAATIVSAPFRAVAPPYYYGPPPPRYYAPPPAYYPPPYYGPR